MRLTKVVWVKQEGAGPRSKPRGFEMGPAQAVQGTVVQGGVFYCPVPPTSVKFFYAVIRSFKKSKELTRTFAAARGLTPPPATSGTSQ